LHLVGILFPHINEDVGSKSHQICTSTCWRAATIAILLFPYIGLVGQALRKVIYVV